MSHNPDQADVDESIDTDPITNPDELIQEPWWADWITPGGEG